MRNDEIQAAIEPLLEKFAPDLEGPDADIAREIVSTALKLAGEQVSRLDRKIVNSAIKEMRHAFRVFAPYKGIRKVSIFGSARTTSVDPEFTAAKEFARQIAELGWMVITGAGPGIMEAGHEGAGGDKSFGANIRLPFEAKPNPVIANDSKLINFKYFFTRKVTFVLLPGGFGTMDEAFELLTLVQTGKTDISPIVMLDRPGGNYWDGFERYVKGELLDRGFVSADDLALFHCVDDPTEAVEEISNFYRVYHSQRLIGRKLILRLTTMPNDAVLAELSDEFSDILAGPIKPTTTSKAELRDQDVPDLPRIAMEFDRQHVGRLRRLIDALNDKVPAGRPPAVKGDPRTL
jgi:uncharacterized protein (TIGR00730 family)